MAVSILTSSISSSILGRGNQSLDTLRQDKALSSFDSFIEPTKSREEFATAAQPQKTSKPQEKSQQHSDILKKETSKTAELSKENTTTKDDSAIEGSQVDDAIDTPKLEATDLLDLDAVANEPEIVAIATIITQTQATQSQEEVVEANEINPEFRDLEIDSESLQEEPKASLLKEFDRQERDIADTPVKPIAQEIDQPEPVAALVTPITTIAKMVEPESKDSIELAQVLSIEDTIDTLKLPVKGNSSRVFDSEISLQERQQGEVLDGESKSTNFITPKIVTTHQQTEILEIAAKKDPILPENNFEVAKQQSTESPQIVQTAGANRLPPELRNIVKSVEVTSTPVIAQVINENPAGDMGFDQGLYDQTADQMALDGELEPHQIFGEHDDTLQIRADLSSSSVTRIDSSNSRDSANIQKQISDSIAHEAPSFERLNSERIVTIKLNPESLGNIEATIKRGNDGKIEVKLTVDTKDTFDIIEKTQKELVIELQKVTKSDDTSFTFNLERGNEGNNNYGENKHRITLDEDQAKRNPTILSQVPNIPSYVNLEVYNSGSVNYLI